MRVEQVPEQEEDSMQPAEASACAWNKCLVTRRIVGSVKEASACAWNKCDSVLSTIVDIYSVRAGRGTSFTKLSAESAFSFSLTRRSRRNFSRCRFRISTSAFAY